MKNRIAFLSLVLLTAAAAVPASADRVLQPVAAQDLNRFIGAEVHGRAYADLGVVSQVDPRLGLVGLTGKNGEFAVLDTSLLMRDGYQMFAPDLTVGHIGQISMNYLEQPNMVARAPIPTINIEEPNE